MQQISGIYAITHLPSGRAYIGSSKDIYGRWAGHQKSLRLGEHHSDHLQNAWNKYGADEFHFGILERCHPDIRVAREQFWIDQIQASNSEFGFNLSSMAHAGCPGEQGRINIGLANKKRIGKPWKPSNPEAWKAKISAGRTGKKYGPRDPAIGLKIAASLRGRPLSEERKAKISKSHTGKIKGPHTEEHKKNLSAAHQGKKHRPDVIEKLLAIHKARSPEMRARIGAKISATKLAKKEAKNHGK